MDILSVAIIIFLILESLNILILYFNPGGRMGNGLGVFNAYEASKAHPEIHRLITYLINWVAGTKLIFVALLIVILLTASASTKAFAVLALVLSILTFFWRLYPAMREMDAAGWITPKGYSRTLGLMIAGFLGGFIVALVMYWLFNVMT